MKYKDEEQERLFNGPEMDPRVVSVVREMDAWLHEKFGKEFFVTGTVRTPAEQAVIYPGNPTKPSPHLITPQNPLCRAVDGRRIHLSNGELIALVGMFSNRWGREHKALLLVDDRGPAQPHLHVAVYKV